MVSFFSLVSGKLIDGTGLVSVSVEVADAVHLITINSHNLGVLNQEVVDVDSFTVSDAFEEVFVLNSFQSIVVVFRI